MLELTAYNMDQINFNTYICTLSKGQSGTSNTRSVTITANSSLQRDMSETSVYCA